MSDSKPRDPMSLYSTSSFGSLKPCAIKEVDVPWSKPRGVGELIPPPLQGLYGSLLESSVHAKGVGGLCVAWQSGLLLFPGAAALSVSMGRGGCSCASSVLIATSHHRLSGRRLRKRVAAAFCGAGGRPPPHSAKTKALAVPRSCLKSLGENASPRRFPFAKASRTPRRTGPSLFLQSRRYCTSPTLLCRRRSLRLCAQLGRFPGFKHLPWSRSGYNQMTQDTLPLQGHKLIMTPAKSSFPPKVTHHGFY